MGAFSRAKGKRGERLTATEIREAIPELAAGVRRGWQSRQGDDDPDVIGLPGFWIEVKKGPKPNVRAALAQATEAVEKKHHPSSSHPRDVPLAVIRDDRKEPFVAMPWDVFLRIMRNHYEMQKTLEDPKYRVTPPPSAPAEEKNIEGAEKTEPAA